AFTLIETLIATFLIAGVLALISLISVNIFKQIKKEKTALPYIESVNYALNIMSNELKEAYIIKTTDNIIIPNPTEIDFKRYKVDNTQTPPTISPNPVDITFKLDNTKLIRIEGPNSSVIAENILSSNDLKFEEIGDFNSPDYFIKIFLKESDPEGKIPPYSKEIQVKIRNSDLNPNYKSVM
ncbi:MAG: hypothetical protein HYU63_08260, partial [Armatimonadetes bacterium]|nr:hypothetical protein [Armatimonadota bacterium]